MSPDLASSNTASVSFAQTTEKSESIAAVVGATNMRAVGGPMPAFVPADELFFWTRDWQQGELESAAEREGGNLRTFENPNDLLTWLLSPED